MRSSFVNSLVRSVSFGKMPNLAKEISSIVYRLYQTTLMRIVHRLIVSVKKTKKYPQSTFPSKWFTNKGFNLDQIALFTSILLVKTLLSYI